MLARSYGTVAVGFGLFILMAVALTTRRPDYLAVCLRWPIPSMLIAAADLIAAVNGQAHPEGGIEIRIACRARFTEIYAPRCSAMGVAGLWAYFTGI